MKIYAKESYTTKCEHLISIYNLCKDYKNKINESPEFENVYKTLYRNFCSNIRKELGINNVLAIGEFKDKDDLLIVLFDKEYKDGDWFQTQADEHGKFYIEV